ncbi:hypothetical protein HKBW3S03_01764, partial [Candidatus Hakubella thermalkaliphila]
MQASWKLHSWLMDPFASFGGVTKA